MTFRSSRPKRRKEGAEIGRDRIPRDQYDEGGDQEHAPFFRRRRLAGQERLRGAAARHGAADAGCKSSTRICKVLRKFVCVLVLRKPGPVVSRSTYTQKRTAGGGVTRLGEVGGGLEDDEGVGGDDRRRDGGEVVRVVGGRGGARGAVHSGVSLCAQRAESS